MSLKLSETRLEERAHRPGIENCEDEVHEALTKETGELKQSIYHLKVKNEELEASKHQLEKLQSDLEDRIR